jgi:hypothetical protein
MNKRKQNQRKKHDLSRSNSSVGKSNGSISGAGRNHASKSNPSNASSNSSKSHDEKEDDAVNADIGTLIAGNTRSVHDENKPDSDVPIVTAPQPQMDEPQATSMVDFVRRNSVNEAKAIIRRSSNSIRSVKLYPEVRPSVRQVAAAHEIQYAPAENQQIEVQHHEVQQA